MTSYLDGGWYVPQTRTRLRTEVIDGAMDVAGMLVRAGVPARRLLRLALKVRTLVVIADPLMRGTSRFGAAERQRVAERLSLYTDDYPELHGFVADCIEQVNGAPDMTAFYLHLVHVARMMQLLDHALHNRIAAGATAREPSAQAKSGRADKRGPSRDTKTARKKATKKGHGQKRKRPEKKTASATGAGKKSASSKRTAGTAPRKKRDSSKKRRKT